MMRDRPSEKQLCSRSNHQNTAVWNWNQIRRPRTGAHPTPRRHGRSAGSGESRWHQFVGVAKKKAKPPVHGQPGPPLVVRSTPVSVLHPVDFLVVDARAEPLRHKILLHLRPVLHHHLDASPEQVGRLCRQIHRLDVAFDHGLSLLRQGGERAKSRNQTNPESEGPAPRET